MKKTKLTKDEIIALAPWILMIALILTTPLWY